MLQTLPTKFSEVLVIVPDVFEDDRGYFKEVFSQPKYEQLGVTEAFVQDNVSRSRKGTLRGMHYDLRMAKLVQCLDGAIYDVIVDVRDGSPTYKRWDAVELDAANHRQLFVPAGFAHGFYVLTAFATVLYKQTAPYDPRHERALSWRDPEIGIDWPLQGTAPVLSAKDAAL